MGRKHLVKSYKMLDSADISANVTSESTNVLNVDTASITLEWTGTAPVGTVEIEATNDETTSASPTWVSLDFGSVISVSGASGNHQLIMTELPFVAIRVKYTSTSGTGNLTATLTMKTTGA